MTIGRKERTRDRILGAAEAVFATKGYHDALVDEIADGVAMSKGGIYFHFPSKEHLFFAVLDRLADRLVAKARLAAAKEASPLKGAEAALQQVLGTLGKRKRLARILVVQGYSMGNAFEAKRVEIFGRFADLIKERLDAAVDSGEVKAIDTTIASQAWIGAINEVVIRWLYEGGRQPPAAFPTLREVLIDGIRSDEDAR